MNYLKYILIAIIIFLLNNKNIKEVNAPYKTDTLINKHNKLNKYFRPYDLVKVNELYSNKDKYLRLSACKHFEQLSRDANKLGYKIKVVSAYRSYFYQQELYNYYFKKMGRKAKYVSSLPGHSEHQLGLSIDVEGSNGDYNKFEKSNEFNWMINNSYKYGFILRYPKNKEKITGYKYEPWHYRYVGVKIAKIIHDNNITLEEYKKTRYN